MSLHPTLSMESATQLAVFLANRPGALARVCEALAQAEINISRADYFRHGRSFRRAHGGERSD